MPRAPLPPRASAASRLRRSAGALSTAATAGMEEQLPWFSELSAQDRSWVGVIVQAGVQNFVEWYAAGGPTLGTPQGGTELAATVFGAAPRALAGVITLQQTVDLVRLSIDVVEASVDDVLEGEDAEAVHAAILRYAREVAFATAE
ncbi:MAG: PucR family transcriptional regulator, partial [Actinomycetota bacterium]|nr:PucR family transcriptional regulator [Actinomycetota bacterium]